MSIDKFEKYSIIIKEEKNKEKKMVAKIWKKVLFFILIIACLFNLVIKFIKIKSLSYELSASAQYMQEQQQKNNK